jgi:hypothetical protein
MTPRSLRFGTWHERGGLDGNAVAPLKDHGACITLHDCRDRAGLVSETAELNARVRDLVDEARRRADEAIEAGDAGELTITLRDTLALLEALADDLSESRAEGAAEYLRNPEFRRVVDQAQGE